MIRKANSSDKVSVLKFCRDTFSWGDYIDQVWDSWISEGSLFLFEKQSPVGICHVFFSEDQIWIEGIRIDPNFRRQKIASELVKHAESMGKERNASFSYMLIDVENNSSLLMSTSLDYHIFESWNFYTLTPKRNLNYDVHFEKSLDCQIYSHYVKSWRWLPVNDSVLSSLCEQNKIIKSTINGNDSVAVLADSEHFDKTLIVTLSSCSDDATLQIISFLQNYGFEKNYERIQILSKDHLRFFDSLEHKISFHLMRKSLLI